MDSIILGHKSATRGCSDDLSGTPGCKISDGTGLFGTGFRGQECLCTGDLCNNSNVEQISTVICTILVIATFIFSFYG